MIICNNLAANSIGDMSFSWGLQNPDVGYKNVREKTQKVLDKVPMARVMLHLPFGRPKKLIAGTWVNEAAMELTSYIDMLNRGYDYLAESFVDTWGSIETEVITYTGSPHLDRRMKHSTITEGRYDNALNFMWKSLRLPLEVGTIALDNSVNAILTTNPIFKMTKGLMDIIESMVPLYIEGTPEYKTDVMQALSEPEISPDYEMVSSELTADEVRATEFVGIGEPTILWDYPTISTDKIFRNRHEAPQHPGAVGRFPLVNADDWYRKEVIVLIAPSDYPDLDRAMKRIEQLEGYGVTPAPMIGLAEKLVDAGLL